MVHIDDLDRIAIEFEQFQQKVKESKAAAEALIPKLLVSSKLMEAIQKLSESHGVEIFVVAPDTDSLNFKFLGPAEVCISFTAGGETFRYFPQRGELPEDLAEFKMEGTEFFLDQDEIDVETFIMGLNILLTETEGQEAEQEDQQGEAADVEALLAELLNM